MVRKYLRLLYRYFVKKSNIDKSVRIDNKKNIVIDASARLLHNVYIQNNFGLFKLGAHSHLGAFCFVNVHNGECIIGDHTSIGPGTKIIVFSNDYHKDKLNTELTLCKDIHIGSNVFIGANCVILPGSIIPDNVVIGAVVKGELQSGYVYGGVPARVIKVI